MRQLGQARGMDRAEDLLSPVLSAAILTPLACKKAYPQVTLNSPTVIVN